MTISDSLVKPEMPLMSLGKYYKTVSQNGGEMYVRVYENDSLIAMKSPLTITQRSGVFNSAGSTEINAEEFEIAFGRIYYELLVIKNK